MKWMEHIPMTPNNMILAIGGWGDQSKKLTVTPVTVAGGIHEQDVTRLRHIL